MAAVMASAIGQSAYAEDVGQWTGFELSVEQKAWFKQMSDGNGLACCDGAAAIQSNMKCATTRTGAIEQRMAASAQECHLATT
jgi:hypothetical protein